MYHGFIVIHLSCKQRRWKNFLCFCGSGKKIHHRKIKAQKSLQASFEISSPLEKHRDPTHHYHQELTLRLTHSTWVWLHLMIIRCPMQIFHPRPFLRLSKWIVVARASFCRRHIPPRSDESVIMSGESKNGIMNDKQSQPPWVSEPLIRYIEGEKKEAFLRNGKGVKQHFH